MGNFWVYVARRSMKDGEGLADLLILTMPRHRFLSPWTKFGFESVKSRVGESSCVRGSDGRISSKAVELVLYLHSPFFAPILSNLKSHKFIWRQKDLYLVNLKCCGTISFRNLFLSWILKARPVGVQEMTSSNPVASALSRMSWRTTGNAWPLPIVPWRRRKSSLRGEECVAPVGVDGAGIVVIFWSFCWRCWQIMWQKSDRRRKIMRRSRIYPKCQEVILIFDLLQHLAQRQTSSILLWFTQKMGREWYSRLRRRGSDTKRKKEKSAPNALFVVKYVDNS